MIAGLALAAALAIAGADARTIVVGAGGEVARIADAAGLARDGDTVEIAPGTYAGDVAVWTQDGLTLRAQACCVVLDAQGAAAEGKAVWVIKGDDVLVEGIAFVGARVAAGNGAGLRHEGGRLTVRGARFSGGQMGLLTWNDPRAVLVVERSAFFGNHRRDEGDAAPAHQLYVGRIARFELRESHLHGGATGHLVKSRARSNLLAYNRIDDGPSGTASYEVEFPEGGDALLVGNLIGQSAHTGNPAVLAWGAEGRADGVQRLALVHNTFIDRRQPPGMAVRMWHGRGALRSANNLLVADGDAEPAANGLTGLDFAIAATAAVRTAAGDPVAAALRAHDLAAVAPDLPVPDREPAAARAGRPLVGPARRPGALQQAAP